jgi:diadenosine tetraphosphate (Ap4A) HIT family hydrolase
MTIAEQVKAAREGTHPRLIARLESGWLFLGDVQPLAGYCVLVADPVVPSLNDLPEASRLVYLRDMARAGDALLSALSAGRVNYEFWGNLDPTLHTHIVPRYSAEPEAQRVLPPRQAYAWGSARPFDAVADAPTITKIRAALAAKLA